MTSDRIKDKDFDAKASAYHFLGTQDRHIVNLFHWIRIMDELIEEVAKSDMDIEFEEELMALSTRLQTEVGHRICMIFP